MEQAVKVFKSHHRFFQINVLPNCCIAFQVASFIYTRSGAAVVYMYNTRYSALVDSLFPVPARIHFCSRSQKLLLSVLHYLSVSIKCSVTTSTLVSFSTHPIHTHHKQLHFLPDVHMWDRLISCSEEVTLLNMTSSLLITILITNYLYHRLYKLAIWYSFRTVFV